MSGFVTWLAGQRIRRVVIIAGLFPLPFLNFISAATVVLSASLRGPREAALDCAAALLLLAGMSLLSGMDTLELSVTAAVSWVVWIGLGSLAGRSGSLTLAVQAAVLLALVGLAIFVAATGDPVAYWVPRLEAWYAELSGQGLTIPADLPRQAALMSGASAAAALVGTLLALLLGLSWSQRIKGQILGDAFRELRLGYVLGGLAAAAGLAGLVGWQLQGALLIFGVAFTFQGVAVVSSWARRYRWPASWWLGLVIPPLLFMGLLVIELTVLAALGFVDNWFSLRRNGSRPAN